MAITYYMHARCTLTIKQAYTCIPSHLSRAAAVWSPATDPSTRPVRLNCVALHYQGQTY